MAMCSLQVSSNKTVSKELCESVVTNEWEGKHLPGESQLSKDYRMGYVHRQSPYSMAVSSPSSRQ